MKNLETPGKTGRVGRYANGKRRSEIRVLPKMEDQCLILAHFCPVTSTSQATSQRKETS